MTVFKAEIEAMQNKAPLIQKSLGVGMIPLFLGNVLMDEVLLDGQVSEMLQFFIEQGYALVRQGATKAWNLAEPIKKPVGRFSK